MATCVKRTLVLVSAAVLLIVSLPEVAPNTSVAQAQNSNKAKRLFKQGKSSYSAGDYLKAAKLFMDAYDQDPKPEILYNIGQAFKESGEHQQALDYFTRYLAAAPDSSNREMVQEMIFTLQQLIAGSLATVTIDGPEAGLDVFIDDSPEAKCQTPCVIALPPGDYKVTADHYGDILSASVRTEVGGTVEVLLEAPPSQSGALVVNTDIKQGVLVIDGEVRGSLPLGPIALEPGFYPVAIELDGQTLWSDTAEVTDGQTTTLEAYLTNRPSPTSETQTGAPARSAAQASSGAMTTTGYALMGLGVGALAAGGIFGLSASQIEGDLQEQLSRGERPNEALIVQGESAALYANVFYGVGATAIASGVIFCLMDTDDNEASPVSTTVQLTPGGALIHTAVEF